MSSLINHKSFIGKTIVKVESAVNQVTFYFTDGTNVRLEIEAIFPSIGLHGIVEQKQ
jgi:hypothetical protein